MESYKISKSWLTNRPEPHDAEFRLPAVPQRDRARSHRRDPVRTGSVTGRSKSGAGRCLDASSTSRDDHRKEVLTVSHCPDQSLSLGGQSVPWEPSTWKHRFSSATPTAAGRCWLTTSIAICMQTTPPCLPVCLRENVSTTVRSGC